LKVDAVRSVSLDVQASVHGDEELTMGFAEGVAAGHFDGVIGFTTTRAAIETV